MFGNISRLRVFENRILRRIFVPKRGENGVWIKLHNQELHSLYRSPDVIRVIKSRRLKWTGHIARMEEGRRAVVDAALDLRIPSSMKLVMKVCLKTDFSGMLQSMQYETCPWLCAVPFESAPRRDFQILEAHKFLKKDEACRKGRMSACLNIATRTTVWQIRVHHRRPEFRL